MAAHPSRQTQGSRAAASSDAATPLQPGLVLGTLPQRAGPIAKAAAAAGASATGQSALARESRQLPSALGGLDPRRRRPPTACTAATRRPLLSTEPSLPSRTPAAASSADNVEPRCGSASTDEAAKGSGRVVPKHQQPAGLDRRRERPINLPVLLATHPQQARPQLKAQPKPQPEAQHKPQPQPQPQPQEKPQAEPQKQQHPLLQLPKKLPEPQPLASPRHLPSPQPQKLLLEHFVQHSAQSSSSASAYRPGEILSKSASLVRAGESRATVAATGTADNYDPADIVPVGDATRDLVGMMGRPSGSATRDHVDMAGLPSGSAVPALPSIGSLGHAAGFCKPCAFIYKAGCQAGVSCRFCHLCAPGEKQRRKREHRAMKRAMQQQLSLP